VLVPRQRDEREPRAANVRELHAPLALAVRPRLAGQLVPVFGNLQLHPIPELLAVRPISIEDGFCSNFTNYSDFNTLNLLYFLKEMDKC
jgi:hypothetical protein